MLTNISEIKMHGFKILEKQGEPIQSGRLRQLTVAFRLKKPGTKAVRVYAFFACECGRVKMMKVSAVRLGRSRRCGCSYKERTTAQNRNS